MSHPHVTDTVTHVSVPKTATGSRLNTREKFNSSNRVAQAIADVVSTCGMLKQWSQDTDVAITVLGNSLEEEVDKYMDVAVTKVFVE